jgi:pimeloyl-ACP methyl ester carboxylesterase
LIGVSFSGGLAIVAAGRTSMRDRVSYVFAIGAHDDLPRVLRYVATGHPPPSPASASGLGAVAAVPPHDYGVAVLLLAIAERLVPPDQTQVLTDAVRRHLAASYEERIDARAAAREFAALRELARTLPEPSASLLDSLNSRDVARLGARLLPYIGFYGDDPALSPARSPRPTAPVYLLHGRDDNIVPAVESEYLAADLAGNTSVRLLLTNLISHAEPVWPAPAAEVTALASFLGDMLDR